MIVVRRLSLKAQFQFRYSGITREDMNEALAANPSWVEVVLAGIHFICVPPKRLERYRPAKFMVGMYWPRLRVFHTDCPPAASIREVS